MPWLLTYANKAAIAESQVPEDSSGTSWDQLAASFQADISVQPKLLTGGELREYQMQVCVAVLLSTQRVDQPNKRLDSPLVMALLDTFGTWHHDVPGR